MLLYVNKAGTDYIYGGQNKIGVHVYHVGITMIICQNGIEFAGHCTQSGTHQWVIHELENRLNGGQCQNKIGGAHLHHVGIAMHAW